MLKAAGLVLLLAVSGRTASPFDSLGLQTGWSIWQNFMPMVPPAGPPVHLSLTLTVANRGSQEVSFQVESLKLFLDGSKKTWWRPKLKTNTDEKLKVAAGETKEFELVPIDDKPFAPEKVVGKGARGELVLRIGKNLRKIPLPQKTIEAVY